MPHVKRSVLAAQATAIHEAGHTVAQWIETMLPGVKKVSIIRTKNALGRMTPKSKKWEISLASEAYVRAVIRVMMAGRIAELICLGEAFLGSGDDIERATALAHRVVAVEGMEKGFGLTNLGQMAQSEHVLKQVDLAVAKILREERANAYNKLQKRKQDILKVTFALLERKQLKTKDLKKILGGRKKWKPKRGTLKRIPKSTRKKS
ncbi:MAG: hypothetical protein QY323_04830 [Patescibacteria group bacterium]|nr:MAG: hypothetical protein QY323_04830 [Patescibacteria group bacterium]